MVQLAILPAFQRHSNQEEEQKEQIRNVFKLTGVRVLTLLSLKFFRHFWYASTAYQARLVSPWVFCLNYLSTKNEPRLDQTYLTCRQNV